MKDYLARLREEFDHIVIDTPPALSVTDAVLLSVEADSVLMVIRSGQTTKAALRRVRDLLSHVNARITGVVVNAFDLHSGSSYYYQYDSKYYGRYYEEMTPPKRRLRRPAKSRSTDNGYLRAAELPAQNHTLIAV